MQKYPDMIKKAVAALTVEHLGCMEWQDNEQMQYKPTASRSGVLPSRKRSLRV